MSRSKKIFLVVGVLFILASIYITVDMFSRTTRPGAKKHLPNSIAPTKK